MPISGVFNSGTNQKRNEDKLISHGANPKTSDAQGVRVLKPLRGDGSEYTPGELYDGPGGKVRMTSNILRVVDKKLMNEYAAKFEKEEEQVISLTQKMLRSGPEVFRFFYGDAAADGLTTAGWPQYVKDGMLARGMSPDAPDALALGAVITSIPTLQLLNRKDKEYIMGMLKLSMLIRHSAIVFENEEADIPAGPIQDYRDVFGVDPHTTLDVKDKGRSVIPAAGSSSQNQ